MNKLTRRMIDGKVRNLKITKCVLIIMVLFFGIVFKFKIQNLNTYILCQVYTVYFDRYEGV